MMMKRLESVVRGDGDVVTHRTLWPTVFALCAYVTAGCASLSPTQSWPELARRASPGTPVAVTDATGTETRGRVSGVDPASLTLDIDGTLRHFPVSEVRQVRRNGDPLWNGLAWGAAVGVAGALLSDSSCAGRTTCGAQTGERLAFVAAMAVAGVGIDALHRDRTLLYRSPSHAVLSIVPAVTPSAGVSISVRVR